MSQRILRSRRTQSDPAVPGVFDGNGELDVRSESPLTPIESERGPSPKGQGYESALSEPDQAESTGPAENPVAQYPQIGGESGGRVVDPTGNDAPENPRTDESLVYPDENVVHKTENSLNSEQELTVRLAEANMSDEQREMIGRRMSSVRIIPEDMDSQEAGPSSGKGKGVDPQNWGAMDLDHDEVSPEIQGQILNSLREARKRREPSPERRARMHDMFEEFQTWQHQEMERIEAKYQAQIEELKEKLDSGKRITDVDLGMKEGVEPVAKYAKPSSVEPPKFPGRPSDLIAPTSHVGKLFDQMKVGPQKESESEDDQGVADLMDVDEAPKTRGMRIKPLKPTEISRMAKCPNIARLKSLPGS